jgi:hypothetical protein
VIVTSAYTPEFGWIAYPGMKKILLLCDRGGSNGYRPRRRCRLTGSWGIDRLHIIVE